MTAVSVDCAVVRQKLCVCGRTAGAPVPSMTVVVMSISA